MAYDIEAHRQRVIEHNSQVAVTITKLKELDIYHTLKKLCVNMDQLGDLYGDAFYNKYNASPDIGVVLQALEDSMIIMRRITMEKMPEESTDE